jgi:hypothetical protein
MQEPLWPDPAAPCILEAHRSQSLCSRSVMHSPYLLKILKLLHLCWNPGSILIVYVPYRYLYRTSRRKPHGSWRRGIFSESLLPRYGAKASTRQLEGLDVILHCNFPQLHLRNMLPR